MNVYHSSKRIDVVVPVYKGRKYIRGIINMIETGQERLHEDVCIGLVLVNDDPDDSFNEDYISDKVDVIAVGTDRNRGIHGARVRGLLFCTGDYVVFLDQDDWISPDYFVRQLAKLGDADAVICRARENGREIYTTEYPFHKTIDYQHMVSVGNMIISPGQVMMRREVIPDAWKQNILKNNGVDDWFLWICMMQEKCKIVLNEEILFEHRVEGGNLSWDSNKMLLSEREMLEMLRTKDILDSEIVSKLENLIALEQQRYIRILEKYRKMFFLYDIWMDLECRLGSISDYLYRHNIRRVTVYGMGYIGAQLAKRFKDTRVSLAGAIDRNAAFIDSDVRIVRLEQFEQETDLVIVTVLENTEKILQEVRYRLGVPVITIYHLLKNWGEGNCIQYE